MLEADIYCIMGLAFASFISLGSMYTYWSIEPHPGWEWLADALVLLWVGIGMSMVAWFKLWIAKPTFGPGEILQQHSFGFAVLMTVCAAASMTSIILFVV
jgi:hypothetical protein